MLAIQRTTAFDRAPLAEGAIRVLYLDDDQLDRELMSLHIHRHHRKENATRYELTAVPSLEDAREVLDTQSVDVFVLDNKMPGSANFHVTLEKLGRIDPNIMLVVTSSEVESAVFKNLDGLEREPDMIVDKAELRDFVNLGMTSDR